MISFQDISLDQIFFKFIQRYLQYKLYINITFYKKKNKFDLLFSLEMSIQ